MIAVRANKAVSQDHPFRIRKTEMSVVRQVDVRCNPVLFLQSVGVAVLPPLVGGSALYGYSQVSFPAGLGGSERCNSRKAFLTN